MNSAPRWHLLSFFVVFFMLFVCLPQYAQAASLCTDTPGYKPQIAADKGVINMFVGLVETKVTDLMKDLYLSFFAVGSTYSVIFYTMLVLYVVIYGVMILFNMASTQPYEILKKLIKISIIAAFMAPDGPASWALFSTFVVPATWELMNDIIAIFGQIAGSTATAASTGTLSKEPLGVVNTAFQMVFSVKYFVMILSTFFTSIAGPFFAFLLVLSAISILRSVIGAIATYFKVLIALSFLLGLAPLFIPLALFSETKKIFMGWVQQIVGLMMQPIMLYAFLSFFMVMIIGTINAIFGSAEYCWVATDFVQGAPQQMRFWRPKVLGQQGTWEVRSDGWLVSLPIDTNDVFLLLILAELAWRYSKYVGEIAKDFGGGALNLATTGGDVRNWFRNNLAKDHTDEMLSQKANVAEAAFTKHRKDIEGTPEAAKLNRDVAIADAIKGGAKKSVIKAAYNAPVIATPADDKEPEPVVNSRTLIEENKMLQAQIDREKDPIKKQAFEEEQKKKLKQIDDAFKQEQQDNNKTNNPATANSQPSDPKNES